MKKKVKLKGRLNIYMRWPIFLSAFLVAATVLMYLFDYRAGLIMTACLVLYIAAASVIYIYLTPSVVDELVNFAIDFAQVQRTLIHDLEIPYAILDDTGKLLWANTCMKEILGEFIDMKNISSLIPEIKADMLPVDEERTYANVHCRDRYYKAEIMKVSIDDFGMDNQVVEMRPEAYRLFAFYLFDETEIQQTRKEIQNQKLICGIILVDNYEEALNSTEEVRRSLLSALVERKITKYMQNYDAIVNKMEKDKYMFVMRQQYLPVLQSSKFSLLDEVREINIGNELSVTLCIGLGVNAGSYAQAQDWARHAIDLALGRGGDQAVVKDKDKISYYGGKTKQVEKTTRVRARVKAHALRQVIEGKEKVVIMGHKIGDVDSFGSAIGVYRAARSLNKKAYIVINDITTSVRPVINHFVDNPEYDSDMFVTSEAARGIVDMNTAMVIVDVNTGARTEGPELLNLTKTIVVIDHHRQSGNSIENPVLSYIEPYASSACEMVAEILQYITDSVKLRPEEADAMYAGLMIDTNNFLSKTGVRTFEAAAFLKKSGADITRIRLKLRDDMPTYKARAEAVKNATVDGSNAYAVCPAEGLESPTIVGAQVANELLNITGIEASFVFTVVKGVIYVSARSFDSMNVQLVMERLGGGGHSTIAGAQLKDMTVEEAIAKVKSVVRSMKMEGEI
ncbi:MAG: DHH family phosphoesterase [Coprococcus sp.]